MTIIEIMAKAIMESKHSLANEVAEDVVNALAKEGIVIGRTFEITDPLLSAMCFRMNLALIKNTP